MSRPLAEPPGWFATWLRTAVLGTTLLIVFFVSYEVFERTVLRDAPVGVLHRAHLARGITAAILLGSWAFVRIRSERIRAERVAREHLLELEARVAERTEEIRRAHEFSELLLDSLRERVLVLDPDGSVRKRNRAAREAPDGGLDEAEPAQLRSALAAGASQAAPRAISVHERSDAAGRLWEVETVPVFDPSSERPSFLLQVQRDVTERRSLEAQVRHQEKMAGLGLMAAGFAHDLGNPLASISSELELLQGETELAPMHESLGVLRQHVQRMSRTLREMVDFARRRRDLHDDVALASVVADAVRLVRHDPRWRAVQLELDVPASLPAVHIVEDHLLLVLLNLLVNAADAMPSGGTVRVRAERSGDALCLTVRDSGCGMSPEVLAQATHPMFTTKPPGRGTGLGLSVSSDVVRAAGGTLELRSVEHEGTEVRITLPVAGTPGATHGAHG